MKVICIHPGNQNSTNPVQVGSIYTAIKVVEGWETQKCDEREYYILKEMGDERAYWVGLFSQLSSIDETELINHKEEVV